MIIEPQSTRYERYLERYFARRYVSPKLTVTTLRYRAACAEHAWLLRVEGLSYYDIAGRLDVTEYEARQMVVRFRKLMWRAVRRAEWQIFPG